MVKRNNNLTLLVEEGLIDPEVVKLKITVIKPFDHIDLNFVVESPQDKERKDSDAT